MYIHHHISINTPTPQAASLSAFQASIIGILINHPTMPCHPTSKDHENTIRRFVFDPSRIYSRINHHNYLSLTLDSPDLPSLAFPFPFSLSLSLSRLLFRLTPVYTSLKFITTPKNLISVSG